MSWQELIDLKNKILRGEEDAKAQRAAVSKPPVRDWWLILEEQQRAAEEARVARERKLTEEHLERQRRESAGRQLAQQLWAKSRDELRARVVEMQQALSGAEQRMVNGELDDAVRAAGEVEVYRVRLQSAEQAFAQHSQRSPM